MALELLGEVSFRLGPPVLPFSTTYDYTDGEDSDELPFVSFARTTEKLHR